MANGKEQLDAINNQATDINTQQAGGDQLASALGTNKSSTDDVLNQITQSLLSRSGVASSTDSELDTFLNESIEATESATEKRESGVKAKFERLRIEEEEEGETSISRAREATRGFALNTGLINRIKQDTEKEIKDLDLREQEFLAIGAMEDAATIRNLKLNKILFKQQSEEKIFSNLISLASLQQGQKQIDLSEKRIGLDEERIGFEERRVDLDEERLDLERDRFIREGTKAKGLDIGELSGEQFDELVSLSRTNPELLGEFFGEGMSGLKAILEVNSARRGEDREELKQIASDFNSADEFISFVSSDQVETAFDLEDIQQVAEDMFGEEISGTGSDSTALTPSGEQRQERQKSRRVERQAKEVLRVVNAVKLGGVVNDKMIKDLGKHMSGGKLSNEVSSLIGSQMTSIVEKIHNRERLSFNEVQTLNKLTTGNIINPRSIIDRIES